MKGSRHDHYPHPGNVENLAPTDYGLSLVINENKRGGEIHNYFKSVCSHFSLYAQMLSSFSLNQYSTD